MSDIDIAIQRLKIEEGFRSRAYDDIDGNKTLGYGFNVGAGISVYAATALLQAQVEEIKSQLSAQPFMQGLDDVRASVLLDVAFNIGVQGLLKFHNTLAAVEAKDWQTAHDGLLASAAAKELPYRYKLLANILLTGEM
jgi:lysozyme